MMFWLLPICELLPQEALAELKSISVLHVRNVENFGAPDRELPPHVPPMGALREITKGHWCGGCPITRKGMTIMDVNRSVVHDVEHFCRTEASIRIGNRPLSYPPPAVCWTLTLISHPAHEPPVQARAKLGISGRMTCCDPGPKGCQACAP